MEQIAPVSGWSLDYIVELDHHRPGTAGAFLRASAERRQVVAALLSTTPLPGCAAAMADLAYFVSSATHRELLGEAFKAVPVGFRGALARSGPQPHPRTFYRLLHKLLSAPEHAAVAGVIKHTDQLDPQRLLIAERLPGDICTPSLVALMPHPRHASDVGKLMSLLSENGVDRRALAEAVRRVTTRDQLSQLWDRWAEKLKFPPHPILASEEHVPITTGEELRRVALRYRNCVRHYITQIMQRESAFSEYRYAGRSAVIHLRLRQRGWTLEGIFGHRNERVSTPMLAAAEQFFGERGVWTGRRPGDDGEWAVLGRLSERLMFDF